MDLSFLLTWQDLPLLTVFLFNYLVLIVFGVWGCHFSLDTWTQSLFIYITSSQMPAPSVAPLDFFILHPAGIG